MVVVVGNQGLGGTKPYFKLAENRGLYAVMLRPPPMSRDVIAKMQYPPLHRARGWVHRPPVLH